MKRDMDLIRELMLTIESLPWEMGDAYTLAPGQPELAKIEASEAEIHHHLELLRDEEFLDCPHQGQPMFGVVVMGITWKGHDFLDSVRDEKVWRETKAGAAKVGGFTAGLLIEVAKGIIKGQLRKHGFDL
jgi:hypothetical protein